MAKQPTQFRVTPEMVEAAIKGKPTYTKLPSKKKIVCEITLKNGFTVTGISSVVDLRNHVEKTGREVALRNAKEAIWQYLGYEMQTLLKADQDLKAGAKRAKAISAAKTNPKTGVKRVTRTRKPAAE
ncbi:hypothetical protein AXY1_20 [Achromobacter phage AXY1]|nr:hypothetical protein AXY1_20 [Achromobacter phage AXY1]